MNQLYYYAIKRKFLQYCSDFPMTVGNNRKNKGDKTSFKKRMENGK